ncbi:MAG: SpoIIIAH-like family protein [Alicyclobacillus macrosporangiidus]|uniref:SpoIIIAH-like family protein n=1 Tax=Alicyclobacillus macrosporangiidus TaxID=392015 RepID=UPI0026EBE1AC|nr:SpoIIIAH-like family protein [Alicyclobacillus macrosporangiidus]MCL6598442.1 SpoIIIAH-like family protein [Alicyclobacillus macrosporangiidus]
MVKRQTVWLSTMMVLSLMLIGYYTMNNDGGLTATKNPDGSSVATSATPPDSGQTSQTGGASATSQSGTSQTGATSQTGTSSQTSTTGNGASQAGATASSSDWYVNMETKLEQQYAQQMDTYNQVISNSSASADQIGQAKQKLEQLQTLVGNLDTARDRVLGQGYKDCVIIPDASGQKAVVYVKTDKLTAQQAVSIMNVVSQQLNLPVVNVTVQAKA